MEHGFNPPIVMATFQYHSGAYISPEMYRDEYDDIILEVVERQQTEGIGLIFVEDTLRNTHVVDIGNLAFIACDEVVSQENVNNSFEVGIDDDDDWFQDVT